MEKGTSARQSGSGLAEKAGEFLIGNDLRVTRLGFGSMRLTGTGIWGEPVDRAESIRVLRRAVELGINLIDTADSYGPNVAEEIIAEALHPYPAGLVIATKGGFERAWAEQMGRERKAGASAVGVRREPATAAPGPHRSLSTASNRSEGAGRRSVRRFEGSTGSGKNQTYRPIRSEREADSGCAEDCFHRKRPESI